MIRRLAVVTVYVILLLSVTLLRPPPTTGPFARDFEAYEAAGVTWARGGDAYGRDVWEAERAIDGVDGSHDELLPFVGPAITLPMWALFARTPHAIAVRIWGGLLAAAACALVAAAWRLARPGNDLVRLWAVIGLAVAAGPMISALALGQVALLSAAATGVALAAYEGRRYAIGAIATLIAAAQPNLVLPLIARVRERGVFAACAAAFVGFVALTLAYGDGVAGFVRYLHVLAAQGDAERFTAIQHTVAGVAYGFGAPDGAARVAGALVLAVSIAGTALATQRLRLSPRDGTLLAIAALPLALPFSHEHDLIIAFIPIVVLAVNARRAARVLAGIATPAIFIDWLGLAQRPHAFAQIVAFGLAGGAAFVALAPRGEARRSFAAPLAVIALALIGGPLALAHPAPTWPDGMPAGWHADPHADAQAVWGEEQRVAGLDAREPAWAALRALPLAGSAVLCVAVALYGRRTV